MIASAGKNSWLPGWQHFCAATVLSVTVLAVFSLVYGAMDYVTQWRTLQRVHFDFELGIPFVPAMTLAYMSMYGLFLIAPFVLRTQRELCALAAALVAAIVVAAVGFLLWPAEAAFPQPENLGIWAGLFQAADRINLRYNMVPSLHVALSIATVAILVRRCRTPVNVILWSWGVLISVSTLLTHQHHLVDVATGAALGIAVGRLVYRRIVEDARGPGHETVMQPVARSAQAVAVARPLARTRQASPARDRTPLA